MSQIVFAIITLFAYIYRMFIIALACYLTIKTDNNSWLWLLLLYVSGTPAGRHLPAENQLVCVRRMI